MLGLKRLMVSGMAVGVLLLGVAGTAPATDYEVDVYGASAQYLYWNAQIPNFLATQKGCTSTPNGQTTDGKNGMTYGSSCTGGHTYTVRYSSKASYDGIMALQNDNSQAGTGACAVGDAVCSPNGGVVPSGQEKQYRKMKADTTNSGTTQNNVCCAKVNLAASDVSGTSFTQESHGALLGPMGGAQTDRKFTGISTAGLQSRQPLVVPFGFFANNNITHTVCLSPDPLSDPAATAHKAISQWGNQCYDDNNDGHSADCIGYYKCVSGVCAGGVNKGAACTKITQCPDVTEAQTSCERVPLDNVSRLMVTQIFSGQATNWTDFGTYYQGGPVVACMRHAGSGTHATFDILMRGNGWGVVTPKSQIAGQIWFNDGSGDEMNCINGKDATHSSGQLIGAIGYADCDQLDGSALAYVHSMKLDGVECRRPKIRNGEYPFYSASWNFWKSSDPNAALIGDLLDFASSPANIPASKAAYWAAISEMNFIKGSDTAWPGYQGADEPQTP